MKITKHVIVRGRVQGVGFRDALHATALRHRVTGWVRNRRDGTLEATLHGWPDDVAQVLSWTRRGPPAASVSSLEVNETSGAFEAFEQRPSD